MTVKDFVNILLDNNCSANATIKIKKELDYNIWVNADLKIESIDRDAIVCTFDFPIEKFEIKRK